MRMKPFGALKLDSLGFGVGLVKGQPLVEMRMKPFGALKRVEVAVAVGVKSAHS